MFGSLLGIRAGSWVRKVFCSPVPKFQVVVLTGRGTRGGLFLSWWIKAFASHEGWVGVVGRVSGLCTPGWRNLKVTAAATKPKPHTFCEQTDLIPH